MPAQIRVSHPAPGAPVYRVKLSPDQLRLCRKLGISPHAYALEVIRQNKQGK